ncbi:MAG: thiamine diphosphokinase [Syntrophales bacterium]|nr:thiamine diphosphokinase [Syntrophales bacterium]
MNKVAFIISGGQIADPQTLRPWLEKEPEAVIICADGGARYAAEIGIVPACIVGDMDSIDGSLLTFFQEKGSAIVRYSPSKNETDTELALSHVLARQPRKVLIFGALGTRMDHSLANIFLLAGAVPPEVDLRIIDESCEMACVTDQMLLRGVAGQTVSLLPLSSVVSGITLRGFEYPLTEGVIEMGKSLGISNRLSGTEGFIGLKTGRLLVIKNSVP